MVACMFTVSAYAYNDSLPFLSVYIQSNTPLLFASHIRSPYADVLTGELVHKLKYHVTTVRDCSWHPWLPMLASCAFDGRVVQWDTGNSFTADLPAPRPDRYDWW